MSEHYILSRCVAIPETGCWLWTGAWSAKGYGSVGHKSQNYAHRLSYETFVGPIPDGMLVCHKCDVRPCCNPDHLFVGTIDDNQKDSARKGRMHRGLSNYNAKLTPELVAVIRGSSLSAAQWSMMTGISRGTISQARRGETWK